MPGPPNAEDWSSFRGILFLSRQAFLCRNRIKKTHGGMIK